MERALGAVLERSRAPERPATRIAGLLDWQVWRQIRGGGWLTGVGPRVVVLRGARSGGSPIPGGRWRAGLVGRGRLERSREQLGASLAAARAVSRSAAALRLQKREEELQRQQKETFSLTQKKDSLLAELQAWEHLIYQLQTEQCKMKSELEKWRVKLGQLQNELGTSSKLYGQAKRQVGHVYYPSYYLNINELAPEDLKEWPDPAELPPEMRSDDLYMVQLQYPYWKKPATPQQVKSLSLSRRNKIVDWQGSNYQYTCGTSYYLEYIPYMKVGMAVEEELEDLKTIVQQHRQSSVDNQNVPITEEAHWHDAFVTLKCDFTELEKKHLEALLQLSHKVYVTKACSTEISKATSKLDDTKKELEGVCADLVMVMQELDLARAEEAMY